MRSIPPIPEAVMDPVAVVTVRLLNNGQVQFAAEGPAANLLNVLGMLELAKASILAQQRPGPIPPIVGVPDGKIPNLRG